jgi:Trp operon repressor
MKDKQAWEKFLSNCQQMDSLTALNPFFELTLTPAECEKIAARYMILSELIHGNCTHREIATKLKVSIFNVTRGANQLKVTPDTAKQLLALQGD